MERTILLTYLKILVRHCQNNYVERSNIMSKSFFIPAISLKFLHNYFDGPTKLFSDLAF